MKELFSKTNWLSSFAMKNGFLSVFLLAPITQIDSCDCLDGCKVGNVCYEDGEVNPGNACEVCDVAQNSLGWTVAAEGTPCDYCLHCNNNGVCTEKNDNCCTTVNFRSAGCAPPPVLLLESGCVFSHSESHPVEGPPGSNWFVGTTLSLVCEDTGDFDLYDISHSLPSDCPGCYPGITESWRTSMCSFEFESNPYQCLEPTCDGGCLVNDTCYADGASNPENSCQVCDASQNAWVTLPIGTACDICLYCSDEGTCSMPDPNCCSTADMPGTCVNAPEEFLEPGCIFTHSWTNQFSSMKTSGTLSVICEAGGAFDFYDETHSLPQSCPGCPELVTDQWEVTDCRQNFTSATYSCTP